MRTDLHIHTTASDGRWTPERLIAGVLAEGIELFAVTDHDTVDNVLSTEALAREAGLAFLRGVEISTTATEHGNGLFHILGYGIDPTHPELLPRLDENRLKLEGTDDDDIRQLIKMGYPINWEEYEAYTYDRERGGFKSLNFMLDKGLCADVRAFFNDIRAKLNHRWPTFLTPAEAVALIRAAGGVPVLAHPGMSLEHTGGVHAETLAPFLEAGIAGIECYSQYHDAETTAACIAFCRQHGILITGGSDYHGGFVNRKLGHPVVDSSELVLGQLLELSRVHLETGGG